MSLSDALLRHPNRTRIRNSLFTLASELEAESAFLIDEAGVVFAAVGHVEFRYPNPLPDSVESGSNRVILEALLGEHRRQRRSPYIVLKVCPRALMVVRYDGPIAGRKRRAAEARVKQTAGDIKALLEI